MSGAVACFSGRVALTTPLRQSSIPQGSPRQQQRNQWRIRSSLEEDFKKHCLDRLNGSSSNPERLKDFSASRLGSGDLEPTTATNLQPPTPPPRDESLPFTVSLPGAQPYHPLEFYPTSQIDLDWGSTSSTDAPWAGVERPRCYVILFGVGRAETEGIYSLRAVAKDDGLPVDTIVAFEAEDDAVRYSTLLEATMDHVPTVWPIEWCELLDFCNSAGYRCRLEPSGSLLIPPDYNMMVTDWEKSMRLRKGEFTVLAAEPGPAMPPLADDPLFLDGPAWVFEAPPATHTEEEVRAEHLNAVIDSHLSSPAGLEAMRASLERLLPQD